MTNERTLNKYLCTKAKNESLLSAMNCDTYNNNTTLQHYDMMHVVAFVICANNIKMNK